MAIRLAFSTVACPQWPLSEVVRRAAEYGYQGVELRTLGAGSSGLASDPMLSETAKVVNELGRPVSRLCAGEPCDALIWTTLRATRYGMSAWERPGALISRASRPRPSPPRASA